MIEHNEKRSGAPSRRASVAGGVPPSFAPVPWFYSYFMIFDCLVIGGAFAYFCLFCLGLDPDIYGRHPFLRRGAAMDGTLYAVMALGLLAALWGLALLALRFLHLRRAVRAHPGLKAALSEGASPGSGGEPGVFSVMGDACKQMLGLKVVVETPEEVAARRAKTEKEEARKAAKRNFRAWIRQPKTRMALSGAGIFLTIFLMPKELALRLGQHMLLFYMLQFASCVAVLVLPLIAWVEPD